MKLMSNLVERLSRSDFGFGMKQEVVKYMSGVGIFFSEFILRVRLVLAANFFSFFVPVYLPIIVNFKRRKTEAAKTI